MVDVEAEEVVGLQQHVAELGVRDAVVGTLEAGLDRLLAHHLVDGEVLADVAQVLERGQRTEPVDVVEQQAPFLGQVEELPELGADALDVGGDGVQGEELTLILFAAWVADHARAAAGQGDGAVATCLEPAQRAELEEVANVE